MHLAAIHRMKLRREKEAMGLHVDEAAAAAEEEEKASENIESDLSVSGVDLYNALRLSA